MANLANALKPNSKEHDALLEHCRALVDMSRETMSAYYDAWDKADNTYRGVVDETESDRKAKQKNEPARMVLPFTYAQVQTYVSFVYSLFMQRPKFYELEGVGPEDVGSPERDSELILDGDLRANKWPTVLYQLLLDAARCGICATKHYWYEKSRKVSVEVPAQGGESFLGAPVSGVPVTQMVDKLVRQGHKILPVSPYRVFPDTRLPLTRAAEGEFIGVEDEYSTTRLREMEGDGMISNVDEIEPFAADAMLTERRLHSTNSTGKGMLTGLSGQSPGVCVVTEVQIWLTPSKFEISEGKPLGDSDVPELYVVWYANDKTILRVEPMNYPHDDFTIDIAQFNNDQQQIVNEGLAELVSQLQDVCSWFINSHVASVRKTIDTKLVVNPQAIEMKDLQNRSPIIRLKPESARGGIDMWLKQLDVRDVTQAHVGDVQTLWSFMQTCTGINDNALGLYNGGRRSAYEARSVNAGAASRLKTGAAVLWETLFVPLGRKMLIDHAEHLTFNLFKKYVGATATEEQFAAWKDSAAECDFRTFDGTAPSEKGYLAQSMQELLLGLLSNPASMQMLMLPSMQNLIKEIAELRGIRGSERFLQAPMELQAMMAQQQQTQQNATRTPPGQTA
jgi:hypothetical protein